jgi:hypothetical protein
MEGAVCQAIVGVADQACTSIDARSAIERTALGARVGAALAAAGSLAGGAFLALHHPVQPAIAVAAFTLACVAAWRWQGAWLVALPACLPAANFAPWTGWIVADEFDLVILAAATAGFARIASLPTGRGRALAADELNRIPSRLLIVTLLCLTAATLAFLRGFTAGDSAAMGWYDGYTSPLNALRTGKSAFYALLLVPLLHVEIGRSGQLAARRIAWGMLAGTIVTVAAVVWERATYPGLFDFAQPYRTTALFWEMHVGGAAIDAYLAMAWPFTAWAVMRSRTPLRWALAALLALLVEYACLTTFSRGLYVSVIGSLAVLVFGLSRRARAPALPAWRRFANAFLLLTILMQGVVVVGSESFMQVRLKQYGNDFSARVAHWRSGVRLLQSGIDWGFGKGFGRLPGEYAATVSQHEWSGAAQVVSEAGGRHLRLSGPDTLQSLAGLYALTQLVPIEPIVYRVGFDARADKPVRVGLSVCTTHLLYDQACQRASVVVASSPGAWQRTSVVLTGPTLASGDWLPRTATFAATVLDAGAQVDLDNVSLGGDGVANVLRNADFSEDLARWFPVAKDYFVPWHIDNLYLELLIEQGLLGLAAFTLLLGGALAALLFSPQRALPSAPYLAASLVGAMIVGLVSSVLDMPRVAFLLYLLAFVSVELGTSRSEPFSP